MTPATEKIVLIDDEKRMCDSLEQLLQGEGFDVVGYQNASEAVEAIKSSKVDLIITDILMPEMDGMEVLREVKRIDEGIPVIILTGNASMDSAIDAVTQGAYDYLLKPVDFNRLVMIVLRAVERRRNEIARLRLVEELRLSNLILQQRVGELDRLYEAGKALGSTSNLSDLLRQIVVLASSVTEANVGSIMLLDEKRQHLKIEAAIGLEDKIILKTKLPIGASIAGYAAQTGEALMIEDVEKDTRFKRINQEKRYGTASLLCVPLHIKNNVLGVINMANKSDGKAFTEDDLRLLSNFASQAAVAVDDASQFQKNRRRLIEFEILHQLAEELPLFNTFEEFRKALTDKLRRVFPIDYAIWFNWDSTDNSLSPSGALGKTSIPLTSSGKIDITKIQREAISINDCNFDKINLEDIPILSEYLVRKIKEIDHLPQPNEAYMAIPITRDGELKYLFYLGADSEKPYSDDDISLAKLVVSQASVLFEKEIALLNSTRLITMGNMISEISHDLRRPLTSISGGLQIIRQKWPEIAKNSDFFDMTMEEIHRMNELVRELVDFSNPNRYQTSRLDLRKIISRASDLLKPDLRRQNVKFSAKFEDLNWEVIINKNQMMEVFLNLFQNALDAMPKGGNLVIKGMVEKPPHRHENYLAVKISDTGIGIKKDKLSMVFGRYYTTKSTGTGLGLPVVERIISAHSGTIHIDSIEGEGTTFTVYLPYQP